MKIARWIFIFLMSSAVALPGWKGETPAQCMAAILLTLNHYPTAEQKEELQTIASNESATPAEQTLARALINVQHFPAPTDKPKLQAIANDASVNTELRDIATAILNLSHKVSAADREKLMVIASVD